jgi:hypothetical protein
MARGYPLDEVMDKLFRSTVLGTVPGTSQVHLRTRSKIAGGQMVTWYSHVDCSTKCTYL